jgi:O-antigen/teichoic acid export membrane protein
LNKLKQLYSGKFIQGITWNFASLAIMTVSGIGMHLLISWIYGASIYGVFNQVYAVYIVASQFAVVGIHLSVLKHSSEYREDSEITTSLLQAGVLLASGFSIVTVLIITGIRNWIGDVYQSPEISTGILYLTPGLVFFSLNKVMLSYLNGLSRIKEYALFQSGRFVFLIISLLIIIGVGSPGYVLPVIFSISEILVFVLVLLRLPEFFSSINLEVVLKWIQRHFSFGIKSFFSNVLLDLNTRVDVLILGYLSGDDVVGIYSLAIVLIEGLYQIPVALRVNYSPILVTQIVQNKWNDLLETVRKGRKFTYLFMLVVGVAAILAFHLGIQLYGQGSEYAQSLPLFIILMTALVISSGYLPFGNIILQAGYPGKHSLMIMIQVLINIILNIILASQFGAMGSAIATGISLIAIIPLMKVFTKRIIHIEM